MVARTARPSIAGARAWAIDLQGVEAPWLLAPAQKVSEQRYNTPEETRRRRNNTEEKVGAQRKGGHKERYANPSEPAGDWDAGQTRQVEKMTQVRQKKGR